MLTHTWALMLGLAAAGLPVLIHWLTRPRPVRVPVSTLRFIQGAVNQRRARYRLRDILVLLLRTVAILLLALAVARPLLNQRVVVANDEEPASTLRIVLLDCSQSMAARSTGIAHFDRARPLARESLRSSMSVKANLLLAAAKPSPVFDGPTTNLSALREALGEATVRPEQLRIQPALNLAAEMLVPSDEETRLELVILSDFQRSNWAAADFSVLPESCDIQLRASTKESDIANLSVLNAKTIGRPETGEESEFTVQVGNFSDAPRNVRVELALGPAVVPLEGHAPARARTTLSGRVPLPGLGWQLGEVRLLGEEDALPQDDALAICTEAHPHPRLAILTRDSNDGIASAGYYVARALAAIGAPASTERDQTTWLDAADPDVETLRSTEVVVIVRPGRLTRQTTAVLAAMLQRGRGFLYVAADALDAANLKDLSEAVGTSARFPVEFMPQQGNRDGAERFLNDVDRRRPPFAVFGDELASALKSLSFRGGLTSRPLPEGLVDDIRGTLSDQSAFLTVTAVGRGRLAVLNADLERSNLGRTPVLVPLLGELIQHELAASREVDHKFDCGEPFTITLPIGEERLEDLQVLGPENAGELSPESHGRFTASQAGVVWEVESAGPPGVYQIRLEDKTVTAVVTAIPESESDLRVLSETVFQDRLSGGRQVSYQMSSSLNLEEQDTTWAWLAVGCVFCILGELVTLKLFRT